MKADDWSERWRATEKPDSKAGCTGRSVGGQLKNQSLRETVSAAALPSPFKILFTLRIFYDPYKLIGHLRGFHL